MWAKAVQTLARNDVFCSTSVDCRPHLARIVQKIGASTRINRSWAEPRFPEGLRCSFWRQALETPSKLAGVDFPGRVASEGSVTFGAPPFYRTRPPTTPPTSQRTRQQRCVGGRVLLLRRSIRDPGRCVTPRSAGRCLPDSGQLHSQTRPQVCRFRAKLGRNWPRSAQHRSTWSLKWPSPVLSGPTSAERGAQRLTQHRSNTGPRQAFVETAPGGGLKGQCAVRVCNRCGTPTVCARDRAEAFLQLIWALVGYYFFNLGKPYSSECSFCAAWASRAILHASC